MISWRLFGQSHSRLLNVRSLGTTAASRKNVASKVKDDNDNDDKKERFIVPMFPYPSGSLHMGHVRVYTLSDVISRYNRLNGRNVIHPMGWDAFGLPAENAAIDKGIQPNSWTRSNINQMRDQLKSMDLQIDWERELFTCDPSYYKWTQWIFLQLYKNGLVEYRNSHVNWDPVDMTVVANEQVDANGKCWRSGALVQKKELKQWFIRTTAFAQQLYDNLDSQELAEWPTAIKEAQRQWIKPGHGHFIKFPIITGGGGERDSLYISVFTTRMDTLPKVTFLALSLDHALAPKNASSGDQVQACTVQNPLTGETLNVYVADYVLSSYGSDAVMGVPTEDERDGSFAALHGIPLLPRKLSDYEDIDELEKKGLVKAATCFKMRDWLGTPIPMIHCKACGVLPVPESDLPVILPIEGVEIQRKGGSPLKHLESWKTSGVFCPKCGEPAERETDTMDTFVDSSWYYFRYLDPHNTERIFDPAKVAPFLPVHLYVGGIEHAILHLLYTRFISHFFHDTLKLIPCREPFQRILAQGMVLGETFRHPTSNVIVHPDNVIKKGKRILFGFQDEMECLVDGSTVYVEKDGDGTVALQVGFEKMSKSKFNGVQPEQVLNQWDSDVMRLFTVYKSPPELDLVWDSNSISGMARFLSKLRKSVMEAKIEPGKTIEDLADFQMSRDGLIQRTDEVIHEVREIFEKTYMINAAVVILTKFYSHVTIKYRYAWVGHCVSDRRVYWRAINVILQFLLPISPQISGQLLDHWNNEGAIVEFLELSEEERKLATVHAIPRLSNDASNRNLNVMFPLVIQVNGMKVQEDLVPKHELDAMLEDDDGALAGYALAKAGLVRDQVTRIVIPKKQHSKSVLVNFVTKKGRERDKKWTIQ